MRIQALTALAATLALLAAGGGLAEAEPPAVTGSLTLEDVFPAGRPSCAGAPPAYRHPGARPPAPILTCAASVIGATPGY